jgi:RNA polymerase sigma-70 factor (ECF subfamily)
MPPHSPSGRFPLAQAFTAARGGIAPDLEALERDLRRLHQRGVERWPGVDVAPERFAAHAARCAVALESADTEGLFLACAALQRDAVALERLAELLRQEVPRAVRRVDPTAAFADELCQLLLQKLVLPEEGRPPKLEQYCGDGPLGRWLRVVAMGTAVSLRRRERHERDTDAPEALAELAAPGDLEVDFLKARYQPLFRDAFAEALAALSPRERNVLRLHLAQGLSIDQLGALYQVHRATAARWLVRAREQLLELTRERLASRLELADAELDSMIQLLRSRFDVSVRRLLEEVP